MLLLGAVVPSGTAAVTIAALSFSLFCTDALTPFRGHKFCMSFSDTVSEAQAGAGQATSKRLREE